MNRVGLFFILHPSAFILLKAGPAVAEIYRRGKDLARDAAGPGVVGGVSGAVRRHRDDPAGAADDDGGVRLLVLQSAGLQVLLRRRTRPLLASATRPAASKLARMRCSRSRSSVFMGSAAPPYGRHGSPISCRRPHAARSPAKVSRQGRRNRPRPRRETPGARRRNRGKTVRPTRRARGVCRPYAPGRPSAPSGTTGRVCAGSRRGRRRALADGRSDMAHLDVADRQRDGECTMSKGHLGRGTVEETSAPPAPYSLLRRCP